MVSGSKKVKTIITSDSPAFISRNTDESTETMLEAIRVASLPKVFAAPKARPLI